MASFLSRLLGRPGARSEYLSPAGDRRGTLNAAGQRIAPFGALFRDPVDDERQSWIEAMVRATDAVHNSGWLSGGIRVATNHIVGTELVPRLVPDRTLFGGPESARDWARNVERRFLSWANDPWSCDFAGRARLGQLTRMAVRHWFVTGDLFALLPYERRPGNEHGLKVNVLPSTRLVDGNGSVQGVFLSASNLPIAYNVRRRSMRPDSIVIEDVVRVAARDATGRRVALHAFEGEPSSVRGMTVLAPALILIRDFARLHGATLRAAQIQTILAMAITSDAEATSTIGAMLQGAVEQETTSPQWDAALGSKSEWYESTSVDIANDLARAVHLYPGDKIEMLQSKNPSANYKAFARLLLLEVARALGIPYTFFTGDHEGSTYSSSRMETAIDWPTTLTRRADIAGAFCQGVFESWLEEDIEIGGTPFPGGLDAFVAQRAAACVVDWRGPPMPQADEEKAAKANEVLFRNRVLTRQAWCGSIGLDWEDVDEQEAMEKANRERLGLDPIATPATPGNQQGAVPSGENGGDNPPEGA